MKKLFLLICLATIGCQSQPPKIQPKVYSKIAVDKLYLPLIDYRRWEKRSDNYGGNEWKHYYRREQYWITYEIVEQGTDSTKEGLALMYTKREEVDRETYNKTKIVDLNTVNK